MAVVMVSAFQGHSRLHAERLAANYCAHCQTGGRILADRALSRLLHGSWPRNLDELG